MTVYDRETPRVDTTILALLRIAHGLETVRLLLTAAPESTEVRKAQDELDRVIGAVERLAQSHE